MCFFAKEVGFNRPRWFESSRLRQVELSYPARDSSKCSIYFFVIIINDFMGIRQIFTLDGRDNVLLEIISQDVDRTSIYKFINKTFDEMVSVLKQKGIEYAELKNALVPHHNKREIAFVFNRENIDSGWYGNDVFVRIIPLLDKRSSHSILVGDMIDREKYTKKIKEEFLTNLVKIRNFDYKVSHQFYLVYLNNLSDEMTKNINRGLLQYTPYVGFLDLTHNSFMKTYLSVTLANCCLKFRDTVIFGHEPDRDNNENVNMSGYRFEENGYSCKSISDDYHGLFLSYKIERQVFPHEKDTKFSINALTDDVHLMPDLNIVVEDSKLIYLLKEKKQI